MPATSPTPSGGTGAAAMPSAAALQCAQRLVRLNTLSGQSNLALIDLAAVVALEPAMKAVEPSAGIRFETSCDMPAFRPGADETAVRLALELASKREAMNVVFGGGVLEEHRARAGALIGWPPAPRRCVREGFLRVQASRRRANLVAFSIHARRPKR